MSVEGLILQDSVKHNITGQNMFLQASEFIPYMELGRDLFAARGVGVRRLREERLATAWAWEGTYARTVRLLTLDA